MNAPITTPPDTPLDQFISGIDALLAEVATGGYVPRAPKRHAWTDPTQYGHYGELLNPPAFAKALMREAETAGVYETGIESNRRGTRGTAINVDCYGYDQSRNLVVIQVRECQFRAGRYSRVRKNYFLLGHTDTGEVFAHPIETPRRLKGLDTPEALVRAVLCKIWQCTDDELDHIVRQGDIALIPHPLPKDAVELPEHDLVLRQTHHLKAAHLYRCPNGEIYVKDGPISLKHTKGQHATVQRRVGCYRVQVGLRAATWSFTLAGKGD